MKFTQFTDKVLNDEVVLARVGAVLVDNFSVLPDKDRKLTQMHVDKIVNSYGTPEQDTVITEAFEACTAYGVDIAAPVMLIRCITQKRIAMRYDIHPWFKDLCAMYRPLVLNARERIVK